eukprot:TRINITY_DN1337_c0_g1_i1.p1 TRINITY_DN1337_c0_g1~~TRINITY_DN1337_c0_g1_i1.p1  ORF type:complete len:179 (+),score=75.96 TRINITY_DN1337_c0_g1_i1:70-606(+)
MNEKHETSDPFDTFIENDIENKKNNDLVDDLLNEPAQKIIREENDKKVVKSEKNLDSFETESSDDFEPKKEEEEQSPFERFKMKTAERLDELYNQEVIGLDKLKREGNQKIQKFKEEFDAKAESCLKQHKAQEKENTKETPKDNNSPNWDCIMKMCLKNNDVVPIGSEMLGVLRGLVN